MISFTPAKVLEIFADNVIVRVNPSPASVTFGFASRTAAPSSFGEGNKQQKGVGHGKNY